MPVRDLFLGQEPKSAVSASASLEHLNDPETIEGILGVASRMLGVSQRRSEVVHVGSPEANMGEFYENFPGGAEAAREYFESACRLLEPEAVAGQLALFETEIVAVTDDRL